MRANGALLAPRAGVHAWSSQRCRSRPRSSRWRCRAHACSRARAGPRGSGDDPVSSAVICAPLRSHRGRRRDCTSRLFATRLGSELRATAHCVQLLAGRYLKVRCSGDGGRAHRRQRAWLPRQPFFGNFFLGSAHEVSFIPLDRTAILHTIRLAYAFEGVRLQPVPETTRK